MDTNAASQLVFEALAHGVAGDTEGAFGKLNAVCERADQPRMYGVCCGLAEAGKLMLQKIYGDQAPRPEHGDMWIFEQLKPGALDNDPPKAFAMRFLVAYCNGDSDTTLALWTATLQASDEEHVASVCALLVDVAGITRLAIEQRKSS